MSELPELIRVNAEAYAAQDDENKMLWTKLDAVRELYEYLRQTVPTAWQPIVICTRLAKILDEPHEPWMGGD